MLLTLYNSNISPIHPLTKVRGVLGYFVKKAMETADSFQQEVLETLQKKVSWSDSAEAMEMDDVLFGLDDAILIAINEWMDRF